MKHFLWSRRVIAIYGILALACAAAFGADQNCPPGVLSEELKHALSLDNPALREGFVARAQKGSLGVLPDAVADLKKTVNPEVNHPEIPRGIYAFESDVQRLFRLAPEHRDLKTFGANWKLSEKDLLDVLTYYGTQVFYNDVRVAGDPSVVFGRLQTVSFQHYLRFSDAPPAQHFGYYMTHIPQKSVPEMALELGLTEGQVYSELSMLRISLVHAFESDPAVAGTQARRFMEHHLHEANRGVGWNRVGRLQGERLHEEEILVRLFEEDLSASEIAQELNEIFPAGAAHPDLRTEASVRAKLSELGLTRPTPRLGEASVFDPEYGYLKLSGRLVEASATRFLFEHYNRDPAWLAARLGVTPETLREFEARNHIVREPGVAKGVRAARPRVANAETQALLDRFEEQRVVVDKVVDWVEKNGRVPTNRELHRWIGIKETQRLFGFSEYKTNGPRGAKQYFENSERAWLAIRQRADFRGVSLRLRDLEIKSAESFTPEFLDALKSEILHDAVPMVAEQQPNLNITTLARSLGVQIDAISGAGAYADGGKRAHKRLFHSSEEFYIQLGEQCHSQGVPWSFFWAKIKEPTSRWMELQRQELRRRVVQLILSKQLEVREASIEKIAGKLNLSAARLVSSRWGAFPDVASFWLSVLDEGNQQGLSLSVLDIPRLEVKSPELKLRLVLEIQIRLQKWLKENRRKPVIADFRKPWPEGLGISYELLFSKGNYSPMQSSSGAALFDSPEEAMRFFREELKAAGIPD